MGTAAQEGFYEAGRAESDALLNTRMEQHDEDVRRLQREEIETEIEKKKREYILTMFDLSIENRIDTLNEVLAIINTSSSDSHIEK